MTAITLSTFGDCRGIACTWGTHLPSCVLSAPLSKEPQWIATAAAIYLVHALILNPGHFVTFSTVSWEIWFESLLLYRIIIPTSNPDGYACTCKVNRYQYIFFWFLSVDVMQVQEPPDSWTSIELCWARNEHVCWMPGILIALVDPFRNWVGAICKSFVSPVADAPPLPWGYK